MSDIEVVNNSDESRYEARIDGQLAGFAEYQLTDAMVVFTHTEVDKAFEGRGVGSTLVRSALDDVRAEGTRSVLPLCPFVKSWIGHHGDYADLVYDAKP